MIPFFHIRYGLGTIQSPTPLPTHARAVRVLGGPVILELVACRRPARVTRPEAHFLPESAHEECNPADEARIPLPASEQLLHPARPRVDFPAPSQRAEVEPSAATEGDPLFGAVKVAARADDRARRDVGANLYTPLGTWAGTAVHAGGTCKLLVPGLVFNRNLSRQPRSV